MNWNCEWGLGKAKKTHNKLTTATKKIGWNFYKDIHIEIFTSDNLNRKEKKIIPDNAPIDSVVGFFMVFNEWRDKNM